MRLLIGAAAAAVAAAAADSPVQAGYTYPWQDPSLPVADRVDSIISLLSVADKVAQLQHGAPAIPAIGWPAYQWAHEAERGDVSAAVGTGYPTPLALGGTFDVALIARIAQLTGIEVRANNNDAARQNYTRSLSTFAPVTNLVRHPQWGRNQEMLGGEDPMLGRVMARAWVASMQGGDLNTPYRIINTIQKHLNAYGGPEGFGTTFGPNAERFAFNAVLDERTWRESFLPAYKGGSEGGVSGYMCSYSAITLTDNLAASDNTPACGNGYLLNGIVRGEWGMHDSYILSDAGAVWFQFSQHHAVDSNQSAAVAAIANGMDIELTCCGAPSVFPLLVDAVGQGIIPEALLDASLRRTLPWRFELGVLDPPGMNPYEALNSSSVANATMQAVALQAAREAIVLLKNDGGALPVAPSTLAGQRVCLLGPSANDTLNHMANYAPKPPFILTPFAGFTAALPQSEVVLAVGCNTTACPTFDPAAVATAATCNLNVMVMGLTGYARSSYKNESGACGCSQGDAVEGECCDRYDVQLPGAQLAFVQAVAALGKPLVLVTVNAGMLNLSWPVASPSVGAILNANYLAQFAGQAIAETVLGLNNPSGRLTSTYYASASDIADIHNYSLAATHMTYRFLEAQPLFPFGYGLSYSRFQYSDIVIAPAGAIAPCDWVNVSVTVTNVAGPAGAEVVQLYLATSNASVPLPVRQLTNWARVDIAAGASVTVTLAVTAEDMAVMRDGDFALQIEPGARTVWVGASSDVAGNGLAGSFAVVGAVTPFDSCPAAAQAVSLPTHALGDGKWAPPVLPRRA